MTRRIILLAVSASLLACVAPSSREPGGAPAVVAEPEPSQGPVVIVEAPPMDAPVSADSTPLTAPDQPPAAAVTGIPECDSYLALYKRCEEYLKPEIMAGNRRFYRAEEAALVYHAGTPEVASMPVACKSMLEQLQTDCPEQHRTP